MNGYPSGSSRRKLSRDQFIKMLEAALESKSFRFGRQAALAWLTIYPGDLYVNYLQANLLLAEGKSSQAVPMLERLVKLDPEAADVYRSLARSTYGIDTQSYEMAVTSLVALKEGRPAGPAVKEWGTSLRESRHLLDRGMLSEAETPLKHVLSRGDAPLIGKVMHLRLTSQTKDAQTLFRLADLYHGQCPDCLQFNLYLADALMHMGNEPEAVNLLHKSMSMDASGQVAERIWGLDHPYRSIWPEELSIHFDVAIPADVAGRLGWNWMLPFTAMTPTNLPQVAAVSGPAVELEANAGIPDLIPETSYEEVAPSLDDPGALEGSAPMPAASMGDEARSSSKRMPRSNRASRGQNTIESEFEKLAKKLHRPAIGRADGRFPVYVLFSSKAGLEGQFGPQTAAIIDVELRRLADVVRRRTGWEAIIFYPDDEKSVSQHGLLPVKDRDPWKLKLAIADLDKALSKRGLMIGMMMIVGGPLVIPFHELPNPTDDYDTSVNSDNPYATLDSNYFVPEWPVGRLPGSNGSDAGLLLEQLRYLVAYHTRRIATRGKGLFTPLASLLAALGRISIFRREKPNYGYTAAVWRRSSLAVFRPVGRPQHVMVSPPQVSGNIPVEKLLAPELGYFNLHGLAETGEWYGQRDPAEPGGGPDYPVALSPKELHRNGHAPRVVFSEACYGGFIQNKCENTALSLKFLSLGTLGVVGSTCIAYGAISTPLVAADLLGNCFWQQVKNGRTIGEALMVAKVELVREMIKRQGYLDAEDQKTLLSFVLYGDPMVSLDSGTKLSKTQLRFRRTGNVKTIEERPVQDSPLPPVTDRVLNEVKEAVASCLPGMDNAEVRIREELGSAAFDTKAGVSPKYSQAESRYVVTLSKSVPNASTVHRHYVRATIDHGKVIKLVVSR